MEKLLECKNITKKFGGKTALDDFSVSLYDGEIYGLAGPNGAGKSTFLKILAGYTNASTGTLELFSEESNLYRVRRNMGFLIENPAFYTYMTGKNNLKYQCELKGINYNDDIINLTKEFKIFDALEKKVKSYSTGMKQRLGLVAATMNKPKILILDEPINGLDPEGIVELRNFLLRINREWKTTIIISSHILNELSLIATRIGFIKNGKIIEESTIEELKEKSISYMALKFDEESINKAVAILETELNISNYKVKNNGLIEIYKNIEINEVLRKLSSNNIYPIAFENKTNSLEDYYIELMGGKINE